MVGPRVLAWPWPLATAALVTVTSCAVGVYASAWLVPPYLVLMALILGVPGGRGGHPRATDLPGREGHPATGDPGAADVLGGEADGPSGSDFDAEAVSDAELEFSNEPGSGSDPRASADAAVDREWGFGPEPNAGKTRRGKGRGRKVKPTTPVLGEPASATWVRVGPGKFVRSDSLSTLPSPPLSSETDGPADGQGPAGIEGGGDAQGLTRTVAETPFVPFGPYPGEDAEPFVVVEAPGPGDPEEVAVVVGPETPGPPSFEATQVVGNPQPGPAEASGSWPLWTESWTIKHAPAIEPGAGEAEGMGSGLGAEPGSGHGLAVGPAPDDSGRETSEDNGIAPDAFGGSTPDVPRAGSRSFALEVQAARDHEPRPDADPVAPPFEPPVACALAAASETASAPIPASEPVGDGGDRDPRFTPGLEAVRPWFRSLLVVSPGLASRRFPDDARPSGQRRAGFAPGNVRRVRPARLTGACRQSRRVRNAGRFRQADRTHPPRSPPANHRP